jgi:hypothetical protein
MKAKLIVEGKEFDIEILDPKLQELLTPKKKTGYELDLDSKWWHELTNGEIAGVYPSSTVNCEPFYAMANYYSDQTVAENNARADRLMRQLRRFAVEHREKEIDWGNENQHKYFISYDRWGKELEVEYDTQYKVCGLIYFDSREAAKLAIEAFKDELFWYFTEYRDSL